MPRKKSALKRLRADKKRRRRNLRIKSELKRLTKKFRLSATGGSLQQAEATFKELSRKLDKATSKGIIRKNTASRKKSHLKKSLETSRSAPGAPAA